MNHVLVARRNFHGNDVTGKLGGKCEFAGPANAAIFGHENRSAACHTLDHAEQAATTTELRVCCHLNRTAHPGKLSGFGDDGFVRFEDELQDGHGGTGDAALHVCSFEKGEYNSGFWLPASGNTFQNESDTGSLDFARDDNTFGFRRKARTDSVSR